jgi:hypothetical protein
MAISPSGSTPNLSAQQLNPAQREGPPPQTRTDGARQGDFSGVTGTSRGGNFKGLAEIRKEFLAKVHQEIGLAKKELELARKNPQGFSGPNHFLEQLKQSFERARASPQTGPRNVDLIDADLKAMRAALEPRAGIPKADPATQTPMTPEEPGLMEIPWKEMTTDQRIRFMDNLRADQQSRIPSKPPGVTALASPAGLGATALDRVQLIAWQTSQQGTTLGADLATLESMLKQATL